ncbi:hypothetical protein COO60DRAFT_1095599 [Scenedesmus sp. NREL 46B-D3]|nr:hypothetical protein COO60DRAFT_1095599 [Scenedesmus sp. NREL 46B-D3]
MLLLDGQYNALDVIGSAPGRVRHAALCSTLLLLHAGSLIGRRVMLCQHSLCTRPLLLLWVLHGCPVYMARTKYAMAACSLMLFQGGGTVLLCSSSWSPGVLLHCCCVLSVLSASALCVSSRVLCFRTKLSCACDVEPCPSRLARLCNWISSRLCSRRPSWTSKCHSCLLQHNFAAGDGVCKTSEFFLPSAGSCVVQAIAVGAVHTVGDLCAPHGHASTVSNSVEPTAMLARTATPQRCARKGGMCLVLLVAWCTDATAVVWLSAITWHELNFGMV